jgi:hypothetical protein
MSNYSQIREIYRQIGLEGHKHEPTGTEVVLIRREEDDYTMVSAKCFYCEGTIIRETTPKGSRPNWQEWRMSE